jgi:hypothetical protein
MTSQIKKLMTPTPNTDPFSLGDRTNVHFINIYRDGIIYLYIVIIIPLLALDDY